MLTKLKRELKYHGDAKKARILQGFFKTGKGEYAEGDIFLGVTVPKSRAVAEKYRDLSFSNTKKLLSSKVHEERLVALLILVHNYQRGSAKTKSLIYTFYLRNTKYINNWDLVDLSASKIVGDHLLGKPKTTLRKLARSKNLWERRIAIIATYEEIINNSFKDTLDISKMLLDDEHDLIHKAVGWMLREVGKRSQSAEEKFLKMHYERMPRTMLRYAIERFSEIKRRAYLSGRA